MNWQEIQNKAINELESRSLRSEYKSQLEFELYEIDKQGANQYWEDIVNSGKKFKNKNHLVLPWLLGITDDKDPIKNRSKPLLTTSRVRDVVEYKNKHGILPLGFIKDPDMPDIDIDCLPDARDPLKEYAIKKYQVDADSDEYGESVCSVGTWQTYKFKNSIIDVCFALGINKDIAYGLTDQLPDEVDDLRERGIGKCKGKIIKDGNKVDCGNKHNLDQCPVCGSPDTDNPTIGKLLKEVDPLREFYDRNFNKMRLSEYGEYESVSGREIIEYAIKLVGRIRNMGMHAGALIIADRPLYGNVPMAKNKDRGYWCSMWSEGQNAQLSKLGYIKWDFLGLKTLQHTYECCRLIEKNRGIKFGEKSKQYKVVLKDGSSQVFDVDTTVETNKGKVSIEELFERYGKRTD